MKSKEFNSKTVQKLKSKQLLAQRKNNPNSLPKEDKDNGNI